MNRNIPIDPELPEGFMDTPNALRNTEELDLWWDRPYAITTSSGYDVRCLNGGAWDRPSFLGNAPTYEEACALAQAKQSIWVKFRSAPMRNIVNGVYQVVRLPQRPDKDVEVLGEFVSQEEADALIRSAS